MKDEIKSIVTIIEEVCEDVCENYCEYRNTIDDYGECDVQRESGECPLDRLMDLILSCSCYSENDIRARKQKLLVGALAGMISDLDAVDIPEPQQPELPIFKNNDQRKAWLRDYKVWGLWYEDKNIGAKYYKYDFENGARLSAGHCS